MGGGSFCWRRQRASSSTRAGFLVLVLWQLFRRQMFVGHSCMSETVLQGKSFYQHLQAVVVGCKQGEHDAVDGSGSHSFITEG